MVKIKKLKHCLEVNDHIISPQIRQKLRREQTVGELKNFKHQPKLKT